MHFYLFLYFGFVWTSLMFCLVVFFSFALGAVLIKEGQRKFKPYKITSHTDASKIHAL